MASIINASTSAGVVATSDTSGILQLQSGGTTIATISSTGLAMNTGNITVASTAAPAFGAYKSTGTSTLSNNTLTKVAFNTEEFDTANCYDPTTNYRFTPNVAGYYQVNAGVLITGSGGSNGYVQCAIYKNGSVYKSTYGTYQTVTATGGATISMLMYFNGSTDYIECYVRQNTGASQNLDTSATDSFFSASMVRSA